MARRTKRANPHRGVKILRRQLASGTITYRARWRDPATGQVHDQSLDALGIQNAIGRRDWAVRKAQELTVERAAGPVSPLTIDDALEGYLKRKGQTKRADTILMYGATLRVFAQWAKARRLVEMRQLDRGALFAARDHLAELPMPRGGKRAVATLNRDLRHLRTFLFDARVRGLLPHADKEIIGAAMAQDPGDRPRPEILPRAEIRALLKAAIRHDATVFKATRDEHEKGHPGGTPRYRPIAPFLLFCLLTGCRLGEARSIRWAKVFLRPPTGGEVIVEPSCTKTRIERAVDLEVCPSLVSLLGALKLQAGDDEYVFGGHEPLSRPLADSSKLRLLRVYKAPGFSWQTLRQCTAAYLTNAPGIYGGSSAYRSAVRLGHGVAVAEKHYLGLVRDIPREARTLEAAMGIEDLAGQIASKMLVRRVAAGE